MIHHLERQNPVSHSDFRAVAELVLRFGNFESGLVDNERVQRNDLLLAMQRQPEPLLQKIPEHEP